MEQDGLLDGDSGTSPVCGSLEEDWPVKLGCKDGNIRHDNFLDGNVVPIGLVCKRKAILVAALRVVQDQCCSGPHLDSVFLSSLSFSYHASNQLDCTVGVCCSFGVFDRW